MKTIVTHAANFHTDDVFAVATVELFFEQKKEKTKLIRTLDQKIWEKGDIVLDIGRIYNPKKNRFDHHQTGGAGTRSNGIPYASFGLVWKKFGKSISGSQDIADIVDENMIMHIDADDNGVSTYKPLFEDVKVFTIDMYIRLEVDTVKGQTDVQEDSSTMHRAFDLKFKELVLWAKKIILAQIANAKIKVKAKKDALKIYTEAADKRIMVMKKFIPSGFGDYPEPLLTVYPDMRGRWSVKTVKIKNEPLKARMNLPKEWWGKSDEELQKVTGVSDARFCHNSGFLVVADSKSGALELAEKALK